MKPSLQKYLEIKDDICIVIPDHIASVQFSMLMPNLEREFPGLRFCTTSSLDHLDHKRFGRVFELRGVDAIVEFFEANGVSMEYLVPAKARGDKVVVADVDCLMYVDGKVSVGSDWTGAAYYCGRESDELYRAARHGVELVVVNPSNACRKMFPGYQFIEK
jgi:hypothetical protein